MLSVESHGHCGRGTRKVTLGAQGPRGIRGPRGSTGAQGPGATSVNDVIVNADSSSADTVYASGAWSYNLWCDYEPVNNSIKAELVVDNDDATPFSIHEVTQTSVNDAPLNQAVLMNVGSDLAFDDNDDSDTEADAVSLAARNGEHAEASLDPFTLVPSGGGQVQQMQAYLKVDQADATCEIDGEVTPST